MGAQPSKSAHPELESGTPCSGSLKNGASVSPTQTDSVRRYRSCSLVTAGSFTTPKAVPTPMPLTSTSSTSSVFGANSFTDCTSSKTTNTLNSSDDDDDDLFTLLCKNRKEPGEAQKVIHPDARQSIDIKLWAHLKAGRSSPQKYGQPASRHSGWNHLHSTNGKHGVGARKTEPQTRSPGTVKKSKHNFFHSTRNRSLPSRNAGIRPYANGNDEDPGSNIRIVDSKTESLRPTTASRIAPPQVAPRSFLSPNQTVHPKADNRGHQAIGSILINGGGLSPHRDAHLLPIRSNGEFGRLRAHQNGKEVMVRCKDNKEPGINAQKQTQKSRAVKKSKLTPFRRANRSSQVHLNTVLDSDKLEEYQQGKHVLSKVDAGTILDATRPRPILEPGGPHQDKVYVRSGDRNLKRRPRQLIKPNHSHIDDSFNTIGRLSSALAPSEEPEIATIQELESRKRPPEFVVPEFKWGYNIKVVDSADIILDEKDKAEKAVTIETFADREKANKYLEKWTSPETNGGIEAIARRTTTLEGRDRLLKVDIEKSDGQHYLMWVERGVVTLEKLNKSKSKQVQWQPNKRPKFFHYVVTCDLITYEINRIARCEEDDDDGASLAEQDGGLGSLGQEITLNIEKLPLMTFTYREHANKYAGYLFLERTKVDKQFANRSDAFWWEHNAVPLHKAAVASACKPDGVYEVAMDVCDMSSRLGWNQILVNVHEVDDVTGPVNF